MRAPGLLLLLATPLLAVVVDRVAVSVGNQAITESEVREEIAVTALLNGETPDYSEPSLRKAEDRLIDQALIRREIELGRYPAAPAQAADPMLASLEKLHGGAAAFARELQRLGLSRDEIKAHLLWQATLLRFIEVRFRPAVQVTDQDLRDYYQQHFSLKPAAPAFEGVRSEIEQSLTAARADQQMEEWLKDARKQARVEYHTAQSLQELRP